MTTLIGIDASADPKKVGVAVAELRDGGPGIVVRSLLANTNDPWGAVGRSIRNNQEAAKRRGDPKPRVLIAIDAPLGWPRKLRSVLESHKAGLPLVPGPQPVPKERKHQATCVFRRRTDHVIRGKIGKWPFEVGADKIARTAHAALLRLEWLRGRLRETEADPVGLRWNPGEVAEGTGVIEVYPAATLKAWKLPDTKYKGSSDGAKTRRKKILDKLPILREGRDQSREDDAALSRAQQNDDALDALVCIQAAVDFVKNKRPEVLRPDTKEEKELARLEGWIWCRKPDAA